MVKTFNISATGYGPYLDRVVFDALHHDRETGQWAEETGHQLGEPARMMWPVGMDRVVFLSQCAGGQGIADYLQTLAPNKEY